MTVLRRRQGTLRLTTAPLPPRLLAVGISSTIPAFELYLTAIQR